MSLCWRCEHRAVAHQSLFGPRYECTDFEHSKQCCYMYQPVKPVILKKVKGDTRAQFAGWMISARSCFVSTCDDLKLKKISYGKKGNAIIWFKPSKV